MDIDFQYVVVGAGVVGLAIARSLALQNKEVLVVEAQEDIGMGVSSRNSEVIHAGLYYTPGSLKAQLCIEGKQLLYDYCEQHGIAYKRLGKLLVATEKDQIPKLEAIQQTAQANGVNDLVWLSAQEAITMEPNLHCVAALYSPSTGIINAHDLMLALQGEAETYGAQFVFNTQLKTIIIENDTNKTSFLCEFNDTENTQIRCAYLINAAGMGAVQLAKNIHGLKTQYVPKEYNYCKGHYFTYPGKAPFSHLIYPMPDQHSLGVHLTLDIGNQTKFGPDVVWVDEEDYQVTEANAKPFYDAVRHYWPGLPDNSLQPGYAGIRPKITPPGDDPWDFMISTEADHGIKGLVNLFGIESPGLTSSLAIGEYVAGRV